MGSSTKTSNQTVPVSLTTTNIGPNDDLKARDYGVEIPGTMNFFDTSSIDPPGAKAFQDYTIAPPNRQRNWEFKPKNVMVQDMRKLRDEKGDDYVNLDKAGFEYHEVIEADEFKDPEWTNGEWIRDVYFPSAQKFFCKRFNVEPSSVILVNAMIRTPFENTYMYNIEGPECIFYGPRIAKFKKKTEKDAPPTGKGYAPLAHTDGYDRMTDDAVQEHCPNGERLRFIGVWKPLDNDVWDMPLAVGDNTTAKDQDYIPYTMTFPSWSDEKHSREGFSSDGYVINSENNITWYSPSHQKPTELLLFKHYDTHPKDELPIRTGHAPFRDQNYWEKEGFPRRESVELRIFVVGGEN